MNWNDAVNMVVLNLRGELIKLVSAGKLTREDFLDLDVVISKIE
jgi:hypothetical protein